MKWFHHECSATHDPKLVLLSEEFEAEGIGVYWGLLELIGYHSDTFHIKVTGVSAEADKAYVNALLCRDDPTASIPVPAGASIPMFGLGILAGLVHTTEERLLEIIEKSASLGILDQYKWHTYGLLHSPAFERSAEAYTRRRRKPADSVVAHSERRPESVSASSQYRPDNSVPLSEQSAENYHKHPEHRFASVKHITASSPHSDCTVSNHIRPEQTTEQTEMQKEREKETEKETQNQIQTETEEDKKLCSVPPLFELTTTYPHTPEDEALDDAVLIPSVEYYTQMCSEFRATITKWNEQERSFVDWLPTDDELKKLFYGGDAAHKLWLCRQAANLTAGRPDFPALVIRGLRLMLEATTKQRIQNPFGWVWSCIHGTPEGMPPWVHQTTALEESARVGSSRSPP
jgi:hypothetical protein